MLYKSDYEWYINQPKPSEYTVDRNKRTENFVYTGAAEREIPGSEIEKL